MKPKTLKKQGPAWLMALPLYLFTLVFVLGPLPAPRRSGE